MASSGHEARIAAGASFDWARLPPLVETLAGVPQDIDRLQFRRVRGSRRGLGQLSGLRQLWLHKADQPTIDDISALSRLQVLSIRGVSATSLAPLGQLKALRRLILIDAPRVENMDWLADLPQLEVLVLEGFWRIRNLSVVEAIGNLISFGFEGGMDRAAVVDSLGPLAGHPRLRNLFLTNTTVADHSLSALRTIPTLERLECAMRFPETEFTALGEALPRLDCDWIRAIAEHGSLRAASSAIRRRIAGR